MRVSGRIGWAGTYMTGLKLLADRVDPACDIGPAPSATARATSVSRRRFVRFAGALNRVYGCRAPSSKHSGSKAAGMSG